MPSQNPEAQSCVMSYLDLRKGIGYIGLFLPFVLVIGKWALQGFGSVQPSISDYYYTDMRNVFVGALCAIGVFLMSYRGYEKADHIAGYLASGFAISVALFPAAPPSNPTADLELHRPRSPDVRSGVLPHARVLLARPLHQDPPQQADVRAQEDTQRRLQGVRLDDRRVHRARGD